MRDNDTRDNIVTDVSLVTFKSKNRNLNLLKTFQHMTKIVIIILYFAVRVDLCVILGDVFLETGSATSTTTSHVTTSGGTRWRPR